MTRAGQEYRFINAPANSFRLDPLFWEALVFPIRWIGCQERWKHLRSCQVCLPADRHFTLALRPRQPTPQAAHLQPPNGST